MKNLITSFQEDLSNENVTQLFIDNNIDVKEGMYVHSLCRSFESSGHYDLSVNIEYDGKEATFTATTTNMSVIDDWAEDDCYFESDDNGHYYDNNEQVFAAALDHILTYRSEEINEWLNE